MSKYKKPVELSIPDSYELGFCPVARQSEHPFTIFNPNARPLTYLFKFTEFAVSPSTGVLLPNSYSQFKVDFTPREASVTVGTVILETEGEPQRVIKLSAVGKYPYISTSLAEINFGQVLVTKTVSRELIIKNSSEVPAEFQVVSRGGEGEFDQQFFGFVPSHGTIPAKMSFSVKTTFSPGFADTKTTASFRVVCASGNEQDLSLRGHSRRFRVAFNATSLNFGEVKLEGSCTRVLTLANSSELATSFEFFTDANNVFLFNSTRGKIPGNSHVKVVL